MAGYLSLDVELMDPFKRHHGSNDEEGLISIKSNDEGLISGVSDINWDIIIGVFKFFRLSLSDSHEARAAISKVWQYPYIILI